MTEREINEPVATVRVCSQSVAIYKLTREKKGRSYTEFRFAYYDKDGARKWASRNTVEAARQEAKDRLALVQTGVESLTIKGDELRDYLYFGERLAPLGISLRKCVDDYADAREIIKGIKGASLVEAARKLVKVHADLQERNVEDVVADLLALREKRTVKGRPASDRYIRDLKHRLEKFAKSFACPVHSVTPKQIEEYADGLKVAPRSRQNNLLAVRTLMRFAQQRKHYPRDVNPMEGIELRFDSDNEIGIFTPDEMRRLLVAAQANRPHLLAFLALGAFAGLRTAEITRLHWSDIGAEYVTVGAAKAKTRSRRLVPVLPNLAAWLALAREDGPIVAEEALQHGFGELTATTARKATKDSPALPAVKWKQNGLRHSFITYRLALVKHEGHVATEAGNSPAMIHQHYRALAEEKTAKEWFEIMPAAKP